MTQELRQIHRLQSWKTFKFMEDPQTGRQTRVPVQQFVADDTDRIKSDGQTYEVQPDGSFYVPVALAEFLTRQPDWYPGPNPFPADPNENPVPRASARKPRTAVAA
jgi:hypothetical protein